MISDEARAAGRSANRRGQAWQRRGAAWLRDGIGVFPGAAHVGQLPQLRGGGGCGDLTGVGDRLIEMTVRPWDRLSEKLRQAERDALAQNLDEWAVWKPMNSKGVAESVVVQLACQWWANAARLDRLESADLLRGSDLEAAEMRGYRLGVAAERAAWDGGHRS